MSLIDAGLNRSRTVLATLVLLLIAGAGAAAAVLRRIRLTVFPLRDINMTSPNSRLCLALTTNQGCSSQPL